MTIYLLCASLELKCQQTQGNEHTGETLGISSWGSKCLWKEHVSSMVGVVGKRLAVVKNKNVVKWLVEWLKW
jgi:hypothetical protein